MKRTYLTLIILMLLVGFAAVTTNLVISGRINFGFNQNDFNNGVIFTYMNIYNGDAIISENKKTIRFNSIKLENVNQETILKYDIANKSLQYDASVTITCGLEEASKSYEQYLKIYNSIEGKFELKSGETKTGYLTVTLIKVYSESLTKDVNMVCTIEATPGERETEGTYTPVEHEYEELILKGADPVLEGTQVQTMSIAATTNKKLIPVIIDETGKVTRADTTKEWYNYENKEWANAIILNDGVVDPGPEKEITESQIESYFVWIPKYRYKLWSMGNYSYIQPEETEYEDKSQEIEIEFGLENTVDDESNVDYKECETPGKSGEDGGCHVGDWMTHPAFTSFGDIKGFWVGKFETGYKGATTKEGAQKDENNSTKVIVKPNVYSWRGIAVKNAFNTSYNYKRELDSHMMKNTEWGAVAYLQHSKYGSEQSVRINNNSAYMTGYAAASEPTTGYTGTSESCAVHPFACNEYETPNKLASDGKVTFNYKNSLSKVASITGNYTGIYDMSGGALEYVMGVMKNANNNEFIFDQSGFVANTFPFNNQENNTKYYDVYNYNTSKTNYNFRILGDATGEMGPFFLKNYGGQNIRTIGSWYGDEARDATSTAPWVERGGNEPDGNITGVFNFGGRRNGGVYPHISFRIVLAPTN